MRLLKCNSCGEKFPKDELIYTSESRKVCKQCHMDASDYRTLIDNLCKLYGVNRPEGLWLKKIKDYKEEGISYAQIWYVMDYITRIIGKKPEEFTIMSVPSYFNSTRKLYDAKYKFDLSLERAGQQKIQKIKVEEVNIIKPNLHKTRMMDIGEL